MRNQISPWALISALFLLLIISLNFTKSCEFSKFQQEDIREKIKSFAEWLQHRAYPKLREAKQQFAWSSPSRKIVTFADFKWRDIKLPENYKLKMKNVRKKVQNYFDELIKKESNVKKEKDARNMLDEIAEEFIKLQVGGIDEWLEAKLDENWRRSTIQQQQQKGASKVKISGGKGSSDTSVHEKDEKLKGIEKGESSSSSRNIENEEKIDVHFLPLKIKDKIYEINKQIWLQNYEPFFNELKMEIEMDQAKILAFYEKIMEVKRNEIGRRFSKWNLIFNKKINQAEEREKNFNKKIANILKNVRNKVSRKSFKKLRNAMNIYLAEEEKKLPEMSLYQKIKIREFIKRTREFIEEFSNWLGGKKENLIINKRKLAQLEAHVAEEMEVIAYKYASKNADAEIRNYNMPPTKNIRNDAVLYDSTALGEMAKFVRNVVDNIESEIGKKYEDETIKMELKSLYYTVLTNRATMLMANYMANEFIWPSENISPRRNKAHQHFMPLPEHSEIEEEIPTTKIERKNFAIENLATISILADFLKNYLDKLNDKIKIRKLIFHFEERKENLKIIEQKIMEPNAKFPPKEYIIEEEDNPLVQSIKSLWPSTKRAKFNILNQKLDEISDRVASMVYNLSSFDQQLTNFNLFKYAMYKNDELPDKFIERNKIKQQKMHLQVRIIVDSMNLLAIFSRMKHLMEKTGMDKRVRHFKDGKIGLEIMKELKDAIENINGQKIPPTLAVFFYDKYAKNVDPQNASSGGGDSQINPNSETQTPTNQSPTSIKRSPTKFRERSPSSSPSPSQYFSPTGQLRDEDEGNEDDVEFGESVIINDEQNDHNENGHEQSDELSNRKKMKAYWALISEGANFDQQEQPESSNKIEPFSDTFVQPDVSPRK